MMSSFQVFGDVKPNISTVHLVLQFSDFSSTVCRVKARQNSLDVCMTLGNQYSFGFEEFTLLPESCHGLGWVQHEGLHIRFNMKDFKKMKTQKGTMQLQQSRLQKLLTDKFTVIKCCFCNHAIANHRFDYVFEAPSDEWGELEESAFCHSHENTSFQCNPSKKCCFLTNNSILIQKDLLLPGTVLFDHFSVKCARCRKVVGKRKKASGSIVIIYLSETVIGPLSDITEIGKNTEDFRSIEAVCEHIIRESDVNHSYRIVIEASDLSDTVQPYVLLWILETTSHQLTHKFTPPQQSEEASKLQVHCVSKLLYKHCLDGGNRELDFYQGDPGNQLTHEIRDK